MKAATTCMVIDVNLLDTVATGMLGICLFALGDNTPSATPRVAMTKSSIELSCKVFVMALILTLIWTVTHVLGLVGIL